MIAWFRHIASNPDRLRLVCSLSTIINLGMIGILTDASMGGEEESADDKVDLGPRLQEQWGLTPQGLNDIYEAWGQEGCDAYIEQADSFIILFLKKLSAMFAIGSLTVFAAMVSGVKDTPGGYAPVVVFTADYIMTVIYNQGCVAFPNKLPYAILLTSTVANVIWLISFVLMVLFPAWCLICRIYRSSLGQQHQD